MSIDETAGNEKLIDAENIFTKELFIDSGKEGTLTIIGTGTLTVTLQMRLQGETTWNDIDSTPTSARYYFRAGGDFWRAGCKTGDFTIGSKTIRIQGQK